MLADRVHQGQLLLKLLCCVGTNSTFEWAPSVTTSRDDNTRHIYAVGWYDWLLYYLNRAALSYKIAFPEQVTWWLPIQVCGRSENTVTAFQTQWASFFFSIPFFRPSDLWQPEEVHSLHTDQQHPRDHTFPLLHHCQHPPAPGNHHHPLYWPGNRHGETHTHTHIGVQKNRFTN